MMKKPVAISTLLALGVLTGLVPAVQAQARVEAEVATSIVDRMPVGGGSEFSADVGELFVWTNVLDAGGTTIEHVWIRDGNEYPVSLAIGGTPWRTWSSKVIPPEWTGAWTVEIRSSDGGILETLNFTVG